MDLGMEQECDYILLANAVSAWKYALAMFGNKIYKTRFTCTGHWSDSINGIISDLNRSS